MAAVNIHEAKTHLSRLVERAAAGEEIVIAKSGKPMARLVPYAEDRQPRVLGAMKGLIHVPDDFDEPLPPENQAAFYGVTPAEVETLFGRAPDVHGHKGTITVEHALGAG